MSEVIQLADIIEVEAFKSIQEKLAKIVMFPVITIDAEGNPMGAWSNFSPFCKLVRSSSEGERRCISCDYEAGKLAMKHRKPQIYRCHLGLQDCVAPIIAEGYFLGAVLGGQVLTDEADRAKIDAERISVEFGLPLQKVREAIGQIPLVSRQYLEDSVNFDTFVANYIAEISMKKMVQEQFLKESRENLLLERKAKTMELKQLQAQINPHFLFNTLNTIARMALIENAPETEELIYNLCDLLHYNLKNVEEFPKIARKSSRLKNISTFRPCATATGFNMRLKSILRLWITASRRWCCSLWWRMPSYTDWSRSATAAPCGSAAAERRITGLSSPLRITGEALIRIFCVRSPTGIRTKAHIRGSDCSTRMNGCAAISANRTA